MKIFFKNIFLLVLFLIINNCSNTRVVVEGVNMVSKHTKPSAANPQGGIVKKEAPLHISNVALIENGEAVRVGYKMEGDKKVRFSKKSDKAI